MFDREARFIHASPGDLRVQLLARLAPVIEAARQPAQP
jgi:hypothetical protein